MRGGGLLDISVTMTGVPEIRQTLVLAADRVRDLRPAFRAIHSGTRSSPLLVGGGGLSFTEMLRSQFHSRGARGGEAWPGYDAEPRYAVIKAKHGGGLHNVLRWVTGRERLYPSLTDPKHPEHIFEMTTHSLRMGTRVPYAIRHQLGQGLQPFDKIPLPRRPIIQVTKMDRDTWILAIQRHIGGAGVRGARKVFAGPQVPGRTI